MMFARLAPRTSKGQCKRSPVEQRAFAVLSVATTLLLTFEGKLRRCDFTWTRYLDRALQVHLVHKPPGLSALARVAVGEMFGLIDVQGRGTLLYFIVGRKGKW